MKLGLGIDTGGTYTDGVIYNFETEEILYTAKTLTRKDNLMKGINNLLDKFSDRILKEITLVSLSTTLATNACVEGKGGRAVLILIGCDEELVAKNRHRYGLPDTNEMIFIPGGHNQQGDIISEPDWELLRKKVLQNSHKTDAFGVVQMWGTRNPEFEIKTKKIIGETTGKPVVCAYELSNELNFLMRASTALLNAQLIPLINEFMDAVRAALNSRGITAPLVIVRGDGSLMSEELAREKPVETLLSGPASSVIGGMNLSEQNDCIVIDMGGTTSDIAIVKDSRVKLAYEGVDVGDWRIGTKSILIKTVGLGGDSLISFDNTEKLLIGPRRVAPLSWLASQWPAVLEDIRQILQNNKYHTRSLCEFLYLVKDISADLDYTEEEQRIVSALKGGPLSILKLTEKVGTSIYNISLDRLEKSGIIMRSGLTPTDIMHVIGHYREWNVEAASMGAKILANRLNMNLDTLIEKVYTRIKQDLYYNVVKMLIENEDQYILNGQMTKQARDLMMMGCRKLESIEQHEDRGYISCAFSTNLKLIGIGAPIHEFLPHVAKVLNTECIIPQNAPVANAVGTITGNIHVEEAVSIRPQYDRDKINGYICYSAERRKKFSKYEEALEWAKELAVSIAKRKAAARGAGEVNVVLSLKKMDGTGEIIEKDINGVDKPILHETNSEETNSVSIQQELNNMVLETIVTARVVGKLKWLES